VTGSFVVVGEALVDVVVPVDGDRHEAVGGSPLNVAVGLSRLEVPTTLVTRIGEDRHGEMLIEHLRDSGVTLSDDSLRAEATTSTATAHLDEQHAATYDFDLVWDLPDQQLDEGTSGLHVGSIGAGIEPGRAVVADLVRQAVTDGVFVSFDPNIRPFFFDDREAAWRVVQSIGSGATLVKLSDEDVRFLRPDADEEDVCRELLDGEQTELVVLTRGPQGATALTEGAVVSVAAPVTDVVDTVGAGDSFMAATLALLWEWGVVAAGEGALSALDDSRVELLLRGAVTAAAVTCSRRGANPPTRQELPPTWPAC
jgi:fructokinase